MKDGKRSQDGAAAPLPKHSVSQLLPWQAIEDFIPKGYLLDLSGVRTDKEDPEFICGPCWVTSLTRSDQGEEWGIVVNWIDRDEKRHDMAVPMARLVERGEPVVGDLMGQGLHVVPGKGKKLVAYLGSFQLPFRRRAVSQLGWQAGNDGDALYVLPSRVIGAAASDTIAFQPEQYSPTIQSMHRRGSLPLWKSHVADRCSGNPLLVFSLAVAFAAPLLKLAGLECGGFHLYGRTSRGKTTALQVAVSVWGCGADPAESSDSHVSKWNTTANALEATAAAHNDGLLALDEMGTCDARDMGKVVYDLFGGKGKRRLTKSSALQLQRTWQLIGISTGEISVREKIEEDGKKARGGQLNRLADIPIGDGVVVDPHGVSADLFVVTLKARCGEFFGNAGPAFIEALIDEYPTLREMQDRVKHDLNAVEKALGHSLPLSDAPGSVTRVLRRFALVSLAGHFACDFGILPFKHEQITDAVRITAQAWLGDDSNKPDGVRGVEMIRAAILENLAQFQDIHDNHATVRGSIIGYRNREIGLFLFDDKQLKRICQGVDVLAVIDELRKQNLLFRNEGDRAKSRHSINAIGGRVRLYAIFEAITDTSEEG